MFLGFHFFSFSFRPFATFRFDFSPGFDVPINYSVLNGFFTFDLSRTTTHKQKTKFLK